MINARLTGLAAAISFCASMAASAHPSLEVSEAKSGSPYMAVVKIPHGCEGEATRSVRVELPEGFISAKPMPKPGWTIATEKGAYQKAYRFYHGKTLSEGVRTVTWSGAELPDEFYDEFTVSGFLAHELAAPTDLYFAVTQTCANGQLNWTEIPAAGGDPHSLKFPAARLKLLGAPQPTSAPPAGGETGHKHH